MRIASRSRSGLTLAVLLLLSIPHVLHAQAPPGVDGTGTRGLDIILLVDVSGSMFFKDTTKPTEPDGSDPRRFRWDAVKVAMDLLTEEDRLAVLPFNHECPARTDDQDRAYVPGKLELGLRFLTPEYRRSLGERILHFAGASDEPTNPSRSEQVNGVLERNAANGGTALLEALAEAGEVIRNQQLGGRSLSVFLLTDGEEWDKSGDYQLFFDGVDRGTRKPVDKWFMDPRFQYFAQNGVPVSTLSLGEGAEARLALARMATATAADFIAVRGSDELLEAFRKHVWSQKGIWQKSFIIAGPNQDLKAIVEDGERLTRLPPPAEVSSGSLQGIRDVGAILYERADQPLGGAERTAFRPTRRLTTKGFPAALGALHREGEARSHVYRHFSGTSAHSPNPGDVFRNQPGLELAFQIQASQRPLIVRFGKRTIPEPLVTLRLRESSYFRHEPIDVAVELQQQADFTLDDFDVFAELHPIGETGVSVFPRCQLAKHSRQPERFLVRTDPEFTAATLPSTGGDFDYYNLKVTLTGRGIESGRKHALSGYELVLPMRTIEVQNAIPLQVPPSSIALTPLQDYREITIAPKAGITLPPDLRLKLKADSRLPAIDGKPLAKDRLLVNWTPAPAAPDQPLLTAQGLQLTLSLPKDPQDPLPEGNYGQGLVLLRSALEPNALNQVLRIVSERDANHPNSGNLYEIPYQLLLNRIGIRFENESELNLAVGPRNARAIQESALLPVKGPSVEELSGVRAGKLTVRLERVATEASLEQPVEFNADELWLEAVDSPSPTRSQQIELPRLGAKFRVHFAPDPRRHKRVRQLLGLHYYQLTATGQGYGEAVAPVRPTVEPPELEIQGTPLAVHTHRGKPEVELRLDARLRWLPHGSWTYVLEPSPGRAMTLQRLVDPAASSTETGEERAIMVPLDDNVAPQLELKVVFPDATGAEPKDSWTTIRPRLRLANAKPSPLPAGRYVGRLSIEDQSKEVSNIPIRLTLDGMQFAAPIVPPEQRTGLDPESPWLQPRPVTANRVVIVQPFEQEIEYTLRLRNELPKSVRFDPEKLVVRPVPPGNGTPLGLLRSTDPERHDLQAAPTVHKITAEQQGESALVTLKLPRVVNAFPGLPYTTKFEVAYADSESQVDLGRQEITLEVIYVDPRELIRTEKSGAAP